MYENSSTFLAMQKILAATDLIHENYSIGKYSGAENVEENFWANKQKG